VADDLLAGFPVVVELPIYWGEMDSLGHVNNIYYFRYFEQSRLEYIRRLGWEGFSVNGGIGPILASVEARYRKPLTWPDTIAVGARISELGTDRLTMEHRIISRKLGVLAAEGKGVIVSYDYSRLAKAPIPDAIRERIGEMEKARSQEAGGRS
jgi:acyl-CoA thioester hydrolase